MSADRWQRLNEIFHEAVALERDARSAFLSDACDGDALLRDELDGLLRAHERAELDSAAIGRLELPYAVEPKPVAGQRFGPYVAVRQIGRGGMGSVLLAERADGQFDQRVAIKLIKRGMDTAQVLDRFRVERQILASLDHPHIARLMDGGTTDGGLPYFVMEYIEGRTIDRYADEHQLPVRQRLELFLQVCDAVSYAHQHLIVHRDIKPQNILVTSDGVPKLLDFGIAKVLQDAGDQGTLTMSEHRLLTPDYASPEQVAGQPTTTRTDVYSLGVVLYELLTGRSPYRPRKWSASDVYESVTTAEIERPSTVVMRPAEQAIRRHAADVDYSVVTGAGTPERLRLQLKGDLDAIVLSALRKEPERRYASVEQLANDIRRHLGGLPVRARADSVWYRAAKFARRNRVAVAAAALIALTLVGGIVATAWQARNARVQAELAQAAQARAEHRFAEVRKLANAVLFDYHDAIKDLAGSTPVRERLVRDALEYLNSLAAEGNADASLERELALAYRKVADVQGGPSGAGLGDTSGAIDSSKRSLAILETLLAASPGDINARRDVADGALQLALLMSVTENQAEALKLARRALGLYEPVVAASAPTLAQRLSLSKTYDVIGTIALESGQANEAMEMHRRQRQVLESASDAERRMPDVRRSLSVAYQHQADAEGTFGDLKAALDSYRRSLQIRMELSAEFPNNADYRSLVGTGHYWVATTMASLGRLREALQEFRHSLRISEELVAADPRGHNITFALTRIGNMLSQLGDHAQALGYYRRARAEFAKDVSGDPGNLWKRGGLIEVDASICASLAHLAQHEDVLPACAKASTLIEETSVEPTNAVIRATLARSYVTMASGLTWLAAQPTVPKAQRLAYQRSATDMLQRSAAIWADMSRLAMLTSADDVEAETVTRALRDAEAGLRRLTKAS